MPIEYNIGNSGEIIVFEDETLDHFNLHRQNTFWKKEAGGALFSSRKKKNKRFITAVGPTRTDRRSRFGFVPDRSKTHAIINEMFLNDLHFVGTWHTHPQRKPKPSLIDSISISNIFAKSTHSLNAMLLIVIGTDQFPRGMNVSLSNSGRLIELSPSDNFSCKTRNLDQNSHSIGSNLRR